MEEKTQTTYSGISGTPKFGDLLLELSARLMSANPSDLDEEINKGLQFLGDFFNFDWNALGEFSDDQNTFNTIYSYFVPCVNKPNVTNFHNETKLITKKVRRGEIVFFRKLPNDLPKDALWDRTFCMNLGVKSSLALPLKLNNDIRGGIYFASIRKELLLTDTLLSELQYFAEIIAGALDRKRMQERLQKTLLEVKYLKENFRGDHIYLKEDSNFENDLYGIIGKNTNFKDVLFKIKQVATTNATVLLLGETGTGKGIIAKAIHNASMRRNMPLIQVNCASLTPSLIESELFGHEKGAFTGAHTRRVGCFERAHGSSLFLDEIAELPMELQAKLLRVLEDGEFERVGGSETIQTNVRVIAATNKDLENEVEAGRFRRELWYRLNIFPISIPPLRERLDDIPHFLTFFMDKYSMWFNKHFNAVPSKTINALQSYSWPGNIRELENLIVRSIISSADRNLQIEIPTQKKYHSTRIKTLEELERTYILDVLGEAFWRIEGPYGAAKRLGLKPSTLRLRMKKLNIKRPEPKTL